MIELFLLTLFLLVGLLCMTSGIVNIMDSYDTFKNTSFEKDARKDGFIYFMIGFILFSSGCIINYFIQT